MIFMEFLKYSCNKKSTKSSEWIIDVGLYNETRRYAYWSVLAGQFSPVLLVKLMDIIPLIAVDSEKEYIKKGVIEML
jgi:hypothetical protein